MIMIREHMITTALLQHTATLRNTLQQTATCVFGGDIIRPRTLASLIYLLLGALVVSEPPPRQKFKSKKTSIFAKET